MQTDVDSDPIQSADVDDALHRIRLVRAEQGEPLSAAIRADCVRLLYENTAAGLFANAVTAILAGLILIPTVPLPTVGLWFGALFTLSAVRAWMASAYGRQAARARADPVAWERAMVAVVTVTGCVWGGYGILAFVHAEPLEAGLAPFVVGGVAAGAVATLGPLPRAYFGFSLPIVIALSICLIRLATPNAWLMAGLVWAFEVAMLATVLRVGTVTRRNIELRLINERLIHSLTENNRTLAAANRSLAEANRSLEHEIAERSRAEARVEFLASHDALTGLPNRRMQQDRFSMAAARAERDAKRVALLFIDLDRFKEVNDSLGHPAGDALLCQVAQRLLVHLRGTDSVCRQGGDEFLVIFGDLADSEAAAVLAQRVMETLAEPIELEERLIRVSASIGVGVYPDDGKDFESLIRRTDKALYRAKRQGGACYCGCSHALDDGGA